METVGYAYPLPGTYIPPIPPPITGLFGGHVQAFFVDSQQRQTYVSIERCDSDIQAFIRFQGDVLMDEKMAVKDVTVELTESSTTPHIKFIFTGHHKNKIKSVELDGSILVQGSADKPEKDCVLSGTMAITSGRWNRSHMCACNAAVCIYVLKDKPDPPQTQQPILKYHNFQSEYITFQQLMLNVYIYA